MTFAEAVTHSEPSPLHVRNLGRIDYCRSLNIQKNIHEALIDGTGEPHLLLCEHNPVITLGKSAKKENILFSAEILADRGIEVVKVDRGGDVTYHGPGQLVVYPLLDLRELRRDVGWYMRLLEEVVIRSLKRFHVPGKRIDGRTGVWIDQPGDGIAAPIERKIASIGVRLSRWCTLHGFSINLNSCRDGFSTINPCGFGDIAITSLEEEQNGAQPAHPPTSEELAAIVVEHFCELFGFIRR